MSFCKIHELNYKTFVEEIPQHQQNAQKMLIDKLHHKNQYIVAKRAQKVIGMVCYNSERPFSLDGKIADLDNYLPGYSKLAEIRLLSISPDERKTRVVYRLLQYLCKVLIELQTDAAVISGTTRQLPLYAKIGFTPFGPLVGNSDASFQPMFITLKKLRYDFKNS